MKQEIGEDVMGNCPLCGFAEYFDEEEREDEFHCRCRRCGSYLIDKDLHFDFLVLQGRSPPDLVGIPNHERALKRGGELWAKRHRVSGWTRQAEVEGLKPPRLTHESAESIIENAPTEVPEKATRFLLNLALMSGEDGSATHEIMSLLDYPLGHATGPEEILYLLDYLAQAGLVSDPRLATGPGGKKGHAQLTVLGWERVREVRTTARSSRQAFVAMNFDEEFDPLYDEAIKPAVRDAGFRPFRIDREEHADRIDDRIIVELDRSRFVVAEFTGQKHGVYFEAGYALGKGRPVIWLCCKDDMKNAHFDTEHYNHIIWEDHADLRKRLTTRITALLG